MRDNFDENTRDILARRVGSHCSNPKCGKPTGGPQVNSAKAMNIGVAAHIAAASPGGKRYDPQQTPEQRKSLENGIWLCQTCAHLIDSDEIRYTVELLKEWKAAAEASALRKIEGNGKQQGGDEADPLEILSTLLDEPDNWIKVEGDEYIRHRYNSKFVIKTGRTITDDFDEPWTRKFPDAHAWSFYVEYWEGSTLLKKSIFVVADGGRYTIPLPKPHNRKPGTFSRENMEYSIDANCLEWKTAMVFDQYFELLWTMLPLVGINLIVHKSGIRH
jgi:hypothetical protein